MKKIAKAIFMFMFTLFSVAYFHNNFDYGSPSDDNIIIIIGGILLLILAYKVGRPYINDYKISVNNSNFTIIMMIHEATWRVVCPIAGIYFAICMINVVSLVLDLTNSILLTGITFIVVFILQVVIISLSFKFANNFNPTKSEVALFWVTSSAFGGFFSISLNDFDLIGLSFTQIGRASCRERV